MAQALKNPVDIFTLPIRLVLEDTWVQDTDSVEQLIMVLYK